MGNTLTAADDIVNMAKQFYLTQKIHLVMTFKSLNHFFLVGRFPTRSLLHIHKGDTTEIMDALAIINMFHTLPYLLKRLVVDMS